MFNIDGVARLPGSTSPRNWRYTAYDATILTGSWMDFIIKDPVHVPFETAQGALDVFYYDVPRDIVLRTKHREGLLMLPQDGYVAGQKDYEFTSFEGQVLRLPIEPSHLPYMHRSG